MASISTHAWVMITYVPVIVDTVDDKVIVSCTPEAREVAQQDSQFGCWLCGEPLRRKALGSFCPGPEKN